MKGGEGRVKILVKASTIDADYYPCIWEEDVGLFEEFDVFVSEVWLVLGSTRAYHMSRYFEFAMI